MTNVTGTILDETGSPSHVKIGFQFMAPATIGAGGVIVAPGTKLILNDESTGEFSIKLEAGTYTVTIYASAVTVLSVFTIYVPSGSSTISIDQLTTAPAPPSPVGSVGQAVAITNGTSGGQITGLNLAYTPVAVILTVEMPDDTGSNVFATVVGDPTSDGFYYSLSAIVPTTGYKLHYLIIA